MCLLPVSLNTYSCKCIPSCPSSKPPVKFPVFAAVTQRRSEMWSMQGPRGNNVARLSLPTFQKSFFVGNLVLSTTQKIRIWNILTISLWHICSCLTHNLNFYNKHTWLRESYAPRISEKGKKDSFVARSHINYSVWKSMAFLLLQKTRFRGT